MALLPLLPAGMHEKCCARDLNLRFWRFGLHSCRCCSSCRRRTCWRLLLWDGRGPSCDSGSDGDGPLQRAFFILCLGISLHLAMPIMWKRWDLIRIYSNDSPFCRNFGDDAQGNKVWHCQAIPSPNCYTPWVKAGRPQCPYRGLDMSVVCCLTQCWNPILFWGLDTIPNRKESLGHLQKRWSIMKPQEDPYNDRITISNIPFNIDSSKST